MTRLEMSHGRPRATLRPDEVPALPVPVGTEAVRDAVTGRFVKGNRASKARTAKRLAKESALLGLDPTKVAPWLAPLVGHAQRYAAQLSATIPQTPALGALAGDAATAEAVYRGLLALATTGETIDVSILSEARAWLREHRTVVATLSALARQETPTTGGEAAAPWLVAADDADPAAPDTDTSASSAKETDHHGG